jgi:hypothetical protein
VRHDERTRKRTVKACGPDAPTLASSRRMMFGIAADDGGKKARLTGESAL